MAVAREQEFRGTERFLIERRLGAGAFGVVYRAFDRQRGAVVALKALRDGNPEALFRLKQEFRALADIAHPNVIALHELLVHDEQWFFTMELVDGVNFLQYVRGAPFPEPVDSGAQTESRARSDYPATPSGETARRAEREWVKAGLAAAATADPDGTAPPPFDPDRLRSALRQAVVGLQALHRAGQLHRDVKPSNVLISRDGKLFLLDFGMVTDLSVSGSRKSISVVGTPAYMSPEQGSARPLSEATDFYSLGVMLFEALTGQWPFTGSFIEMMWDKRHKEAPSPREIAPEIPEDLAALCADLLSRDPEKRPTGDQILARLGAVQAATYRPPAPPAAARRTPPFVGREGHLETLRSAFAVARAGAAVVVRLHGPSGAGKTALARRFLQEARRSGAVVLAGRCYERESVPYKALDSLVDALSQFLKKLPPAEANEILPTDVLALARLFPVLRRVESIAGARRRVLEIPDSQELRRRAFAALRELFARLAERQDVVLFLDDLQWGDVDSAALLSDLLHPPGAPPLLLLACYRSEEAATSPFLQRFLAPGAAGELPKPVELPVGELSEREARDLTVALLGGEEESLRASVDEIVRESGGNPFFLSELVRYAQAGIDPSEAGAARRTPRGATLEDVIRSRIERLPGPARLLLEILAVAGQPLRPAVARQASGMEEDAGAIDLLRSSHLIRIRASQERNEIEPYHDRIRETVVAQLSPDALRAHHRRLAAALEGSRSTDPEALALHFQEAGEFERASEYSAVAANRAAEALAFDRAARLYRLSRELRHSSKANARRVLSVKLGDALANAGRGAEAAQAYLEAVPGAPAADALELRHRAAEQYLTSGHIAEGISALGTVLEQVGLRMAATPRTALLSMLLRRAILRLRGTRFRERDSTQIAAEKLRRIDVCWSAAKGLTLSDLIRGNDFQARHALLALRAGEPYRVARALTMEAAHSGMGGGRTRKRTEQLLATATAIGQRLDHPYTIGFALSVAGVTAFLEGRWRDALDFTERAGLMLRERCRGVAWELDNTDYYSLLTLFYLGELKRLEETLPGFLKQAEDRGDLYVTTSMRTRLSYLVRLAKDEALRAREELRNAISIWPADGFLLQHWYEMMGQVECLLYMGDGAAAWRLARERWPLLKRSLILRTQSVRIHSLSFRARAAIAAADGGGDDPHLLAFAEKDARRIERERMPWGNALAGLLRGGIASVRGEREMAVTRLASAARELASADMALHAAVAERRRGELLGGEEGGAIVEASDAWLAGQGIRNPAGMAGMLAPGRWS